MSANHGGGVAAVRVEFRPEKGRRTSERREMGTFRLFRPVVSGGKTAGDDHDAIRGYASTFVRVRSTYVHTRRN